MNNPSPKNNYLFSIPILCAALVSLISVLQPNVLNFSLKTHDIITVFLSVVIEASPFLLLGSLVSVIIQKTNAVQTVIKHIPKNPVFGLPVAAGLGTLLPLCECGNMPIARSLAQKGLPKSFATTFLFSAPILNPAVFLSTWIAFQGNFVLIAARFILGFIVAISAGLYTLWQEKNGVPIWKEVYQESSKNEQAHSHKTESFPVRVFTEFFAIFPYLLIGALFTALFQAYVPREFFFNQDFGIAIAILFMMFFAFIISVCSNTDAFLALGFVGFVPTSAILSFLVFGPMIDTKNVLIYSRIFTLRGVVLISLFIAELVFLLSLITHKTGIL